MKKILSFFRRLRRSRWIDDASLSDRSARQAQPLKTITLEMGEYHWVN